MQGTVLEKILEKLNYPNHGINMIHMHVFTDNSHTKPAID